MAARVLSDYVFPPLADIIKEYAQEVLVYLAEPRIEYREIYSDEAYQPYQVGTTETWKVLPIEDAYAEQISRGRTASAITIVTNPIEVDQFLLDHPSGTYGIYTQLRKPKLIR